MADIALKDLTAEHLGQRVKLRFHHKGSGVVGYSDATGTLLSVTHALNVEENSLPKTSIQVLVLNETMRLNWPSDATLEFIDHEESAGLMI